ncbi:MAG TPA: ABC transporter permease subunit, partial [Thermoleophilaceae bacterium]|nr:ABC transporter permease subunit [Thermoleophilaceae bacterium]
GLAAYQWPRLYPPMRAATQILYTVPALAMFVLLVSLVGLGPLPVVFALASYSLVILVANLVEGLRAVPRDVVQAATAMGYRQWARVVRVELPLATPALLAGLRAATVSTISLVSLGAVIGTGGLGQLFIHGFQIDNPIEIWAGLVLTVALALVADLLLLAAAAGIAPWTRAAR